MARAAPMSDLVRQLQAHLATSDRVSGLSVAALEKPGRRDAAVVGRLTSEAASLVHAAPAVQEVQRTQERLLVRFSDDAIAAHGARLEAGEGRSLDCTDLLDGARWVVDFCDPNATKALHVGHLRNLAIGNALASMLEAGGASVVRQSQVADAGHQIGDAMAGYLWHVDDDGPEATGEKSDHFVGRCYAAVAADQQPASGTSHAADLPVAAEMRTEPDAASRLMRGWVARDEEIVELWRTLRDWVTTGHRATLSRLGIRVDRELFESASFARIPALVDRAVQAGVLARTADGRVTYATDDEDYPVFPLARADGFPNQNLRALITYHDMMLELRDATMIQVCGTEWRAHHLYVERILRQLCPSVPVQPARCVFLEMVEEGGEAVSSSTGEALLIDELLDRLTAEAPLRELARAEDTTCDTDRLAVLAALGFCLGTRMSRRMTITSKAVLDERSPGLLFVRAWTKAWDPALDGPPDPHPGDPAYRFAVAQSQFYHDQIARSLASLDYLPLVQFLLRMSRWYVSATTGAHTSRVMRALLRRGFRDLGLVRPEAATGL